MQLEKSLGFLTSSYADDPALLEQFQAATIQAFGFTYELTAKMVRRQLQEDAISPSEIRALGFMDLMRRAADAGLVRDASPWHTFRELRNRTSHTYDREEARIVLESVPDFLDEAQSVLAVLEKRNAR